MRKIEKEKCEMLLLWYNDYLAKTGRKYVPEEEFDKRYRWLLGDYPYWYSWGYFSRDHGCVGLLQKFQDF